MDLEGIMLSEIRENQTLCDLVYMRNLDKPNSETEQTGVCKVGGKGGEGGQKIHSVQTSAHLMSKFWGRFNVQRAEQQFYSLENCYESRS